MMLMFGFRNTKRKRPHQSRYHFYSFKKGDKRVVDGGYKHIRIAAYGYGKAHDQEFCVTQEAEKVMVERIK